MTSASLAGLGARLEMNPLVEDDALQEAQLLEVRLDAVTGQVGVLFELRMALQLREPNTGVLVARGVRHLGWSCPSRETGRTAWSVGGSRVSRQAGLFSLMLGLWPSPGAELELVAESAMFVSGDVPGLEEAPPDYGSEDDLVASGQLASWSSPSVPSSAVFFGSGGFS